MIGSVSWDPRSKDTICATVPKGTVCHSQNNVPTSTRLIEMSTVAYTPKGFLAALKGLSPLPQGEGVHRDSVTRLLVRTQIQKKSDSMMMGYNLDSL